MKKLISLLFAVLVSTMMFGQVSMDLNVIGRVDANPRFTFDGEKPTFNWANTSVYTKLETTINEKFTILLVNHWAASGEGVYFLPWDHKYQEIVPYVPFGATPDLYTSTWMSDSSTWVDYLYVDYKINDNWSVRAGKDCIAVGGFEYDDWDWDVDYDMASTYWNGNAAYQWGVSGAWTNNSGNTTLRLQAVSSPCAYNLNDVSRPWYKGCGSYYFQHDGSYGIIETRNAIGFYQIGGFDDNKFERHNTIHESAGIRANLLDESLIVGADILNEYTMEAKVNRFHFLATGKYIAPSEKWEVLGKIGIENLGYKGEGSSTSIFGGVSGAYFPLKDSQDLRLQGTIAYNPYFNKGLSLTIGLTYNLPIHIL